jgi:HAD superfamily hydrolase (TIGR01509 family)
MSSPHRYSLIFDCDGVLADTERYGHLPAFNEAFVRLGVPMQWSEDDYAVLVRIGGGKERISAALADPRRGLLSEPGVTAELVQRIHAVKTDIYRSMVAQGAMPPRPGVARLIRSALANDWHVAIASTSAPESVRSVLDSVIGHDIADGIPLFAGDSVAAKKPAPDVYLLALDRLGAEPNFTVVVEDSEVGLGAARAAELACIVTPSSYTVTEDFSAAAAVVSTLGERDQPAVVLADPHGVAFGEFVDLDALQRLLDLRNHTYTSTRWENR